MCPAVGRIPRRCIVCRRVVQEVGIGPTIFSFKAKHFTIKLLLKKVCQVVCAYQTGLGFVLRYHRELPSLQEGYTL